MEFFFFTIYVYVEKTKMRPKRPKTKKENRTVHFGEHPQF